MQALPPRTTYDDKFYIGFYEKEQLAAVMDLILHYPNGSTAFIGFFMMERAMQGRGLGSGIIGEALAFLKRAGFHAVRLGYMKGNEQSRSFWIKNGFTPTGLETYNGQGTVVILERQLSDRKQEETI